MPWFERRLVGQSAMIELLNLLTVELETTPD